MAPGLPTCKKHGLAYDPAVSTGCVVCRRSEQGPEYRGAYGLIRWWPALALATVAVVSAGVIVVSAPAVIGASVPADSGEPPPVVVNARPRPRSLAPASPQDQAEAERVRLVADLEALLEQVRPHTVACFEGAESACLQAGSRCVDLMKHLDLPAQKATALAAPRRKLYNPDIDSAWARLCGAKGTAPYDKSCELGNQDSCKTACDLGSRQGCLAFAEAQTDPQLAESYRHRSSVLAECEHRGIHPCILPPAQPITTINTAEELSISKDEEECEQSVGRACLSLARRYEAGEGLTKNLHRSLELRQRACDQPPHLCLDLARMYTLGVAVPQDEQRALTLVARDYSGLAESAAGCDQKPNLECAFVTLGAEAAKSPEFLARFAPRTYEAHCRRGDFRACQSVEQLYRNGEHGVAKDVAKADQLAALAAAARISQTNRQP